MFVRLNVTALMARNSRAQGGRRGAKATRSRPSRRPVRSPGHPSIDDLAAVVARGAHELLALDDPLEGEVWASSIMGTFYKVAGPLEARLELETRLWPAVIAAAEALRDAAGRAALEAIAEVGEPAMRLLARAAAGRLEREGVPAPRWASELGSAAFEGAWVLQDVFGDHEAYFATFRYPGREPHVVNALYDKALGGIIKDAFVGYPVEDPRLNIAREDGVFSVDVEPEPVARRIIDAIELGDTYLDRLDARVPAVPGARAGSDAAAAGGRGAGTPRASRRCGTGRAHGRVPGVRRRRRPR